ncbi:hypothetical protein OKW33_000667 [Paraburkholderia atlantica]
MRDFSSADQLMAELAPQECAHDGRTKQKRSLAGNGKTPSTHSLNNYSTDRSPVFALHGYQNS